MTTDLQERREALYARLEDPESKQARGTLRNDRGMCCLGHACDVALELGYDKEGWKKREDTGLNRETWTFGLLSGVMPHGVADFFGFTTGNPRTRIKWGATNNVTLATLNDEGKTLPEIAEIMRTEPVWRDHDVLPESGTT